MWPRRASDVEQAFQVKMQVYQHPTENRTFYAPDVEPSVEAGIPIQGINGLNNFSPPRPMVKHSLRRKYTSQPDRIRPGRPVSGQRYEGGLLRRNGADGRRTSCRTIRVRSVQPQRCEAYFSTINQPLNVPVVNVLLDGISPICGAGCDDGEQVIDIQQAISMAPGLSAVIVYEGYGRHRYAQPDGCR